MKRDMDLLRLMLFLIEDDDRADGRFGIHNYHVAGYPDAVVEYHLRLAAEAGLVQLYMSEPTSPSIMLGRLSWAGHEFVEAARNDTVWNKAKAHVLSKTGGMVLDVLKSALVEFAKQAMKP